MVTDEEYLNPETGVFTVEKIHPMFDIEISSLWKKLHQAENPYHISIPTVIRKEFLESVLVYLQCHLPEFRTPNSLEIVHQIFE